MEIQMYQLDIKNIDKSIEELALRLKFWTKTGENDG
jgi:hypothetical protein